MDENHATVALLEAEAGGGPSSAADRQPDDAAAVVVRPKQHWLHGVARVVCECMLIACLFVISSMEVREGPSRRHQLALIGLAYAAIAALMWLGRALPADDGSARWKKLAATLAATAVGGVLGYCTNSVPWSAYMLIVVCVYS